MVMHRLCGSVLGLLALVAGPGLAQPADPLVRSINAARRAAGLPALQPLPPALVESNSAYLRPLLTELLASRTCNHDLHRWQAFQAAAAGRFSLTPASEVMACTANTRGWGADRIVGQLLASPVHAGILLNRPRLQFVDCLRADADGRAAAVCTLWAERAP